MTSSHFVVGNQSCDLDSVVSALVLSHLYGARALLQCRRAEFALRVDSLAVLSAASIAELCFLHDDVTETELLRLHAERRLRLTLVDHNRCTLPSAAALSDAIVGIVDHHQIESHLQSQQLACPLVLVEPVGSCCTLVGQLVAHCVTPSDAELLLRTIAVDTLNFDAALKQLCVRRRRCGALCCARLLRTCPVLDWRFWSSAPRLSMRR
jgi:exopolyphosphatase